MHSSHPQQLHLGICDPESPARDNNEWERMRKLELLQSDSSLG